MIELSDKLRLEKLLSDTIPLLCKNSLGCQLAFNVEALIGITIGDDGSGNGQMFMVSFKQAISAAGFAKSYKWMEQSASAEACLSTANSVVECIEQPVNNRTDRVRKRPPSQEIATKYDDSWQGFNIWQDNANSNERLSSSSSWQIRRSHPHNSATHHTASETEEMNNVIKIEADCDEYSDAKTDFEESTSNLQAWSYGYDNSQEVHVSDAGNANHSDNFGGKSRFRSLGKSESRPKGKWSSIGTKNAKLAAKYRHFQNAGGTSTRANGRRLGHARPSATVSAMQPEESQFDQAVNMMNIASEHGPTDCSSMQHGLHSPVLIPPTAGRPNPTKRCRVCYMAKMRREVRFCCWQCPDRPGLCIERCFQLYHGMAGVSPDKICTDFTSNDGGPE